MLGAGQHRRPSPTPRARMPGAEGDSGEGRNDSGRDAEHRGLVGSPLPRAAIPSAPSPIREGGLSSDIVHVSSSGLLRSRAGVDRASQ